MAEFIECPECGGPLVGVGADIRCTQCGFTRDEFEDFEDVEDLYDSDVYDEVEEIDDYDIEDID